MQTLAPICNSAKTMVEVNSVANPSSVNQETTSMVGGEVVQNPSMKERLLPPQLVAKNPNNQLSSPINWSPKTLAMNLCRHSDER